MMQSEQLIVGSKYKDTLANSLQADVCWIPDNPYVDPRLSGHADLSVCVVDKKTYALKYLENTVKSINCEFIDENIGKKYPNDAKMNACIVGKRVFCNKSTISQYIFEKMIEGEYSIVNVNQGYCRCSIFPVTENAIITSDKGIINTAKDINFDVLEIEPGFIDLEGFQYGFIGGTGFVDNGIAFLTGQLQFHPDRDRILSFCRNYGINIEYLTNRNIFDIGGIIKTG